MTNASPTPKTVRRTIASRVRGAANVLTLLGAIAVAIGWAMHWPPAILGRAALVALVAFVTSFVAILIENRQTSKAEGDA